MGVEGTRSTSDAVTMPYKGALKPPDTGCFDTLPGEGYEGASAGRAGTAALCMASWRTLAGTNEVLGVHNLPLSSRARELVDYESTQAILVEGSGAIFGHSVSSTSSSAPLPYSNPWP